MGSIFEWRSALIARDKNRGEVSLVSGGVHLNWSSARGLYSLGGFPAVCTGACCRAIACIRIGSGHVDRLMGERSLPMNVVRVIFEGGNNDCVFKGTQ